MVLLDVIWYPIGLLVDPSTLPGEHCQRMPPDLCQAAGMDDRNMCRFRGCERRIKRMTGALHNGRQLRHPGGIIIVQTHCCINDMRYPTHPAASEPSLYWRRLATTTHLSLDAIDLRIAPGRLSADSDQFIPYR
jgi:hypothetical protein